MDCLELLTQQHTRIDTLVAKLERGGEDSEAIFAELADVLAAHARIEEEIFYPAALTQETAGMLHEATEEHLAVKRVLADMLELTVDDEIFAAKLAVLKEQLHHHAHEEEEDKLFPKVRERLDEEQRFALGSEMLALFEETMEGEPRFEITVETDEAATLN